MFDQASKVPFLGVDELDDILPGRPLAARQCNGRITESLFGVYRFAERVKDYYLVIARVDAAYGAIIGGGIRTYL